MWNKKWNPLIDIVVGTRRIVLKYFIPNQPNDYALKSDGSPLSIADLEINSYLATNLQKFYPQIAIVSEENDADQNLEAMLRDEVFIIDPLDGTQSFIEGNPEFTVNVALKINKSLELGIIYLPVDDVLYYADSEIGCLKIINASKEERDIVLLQTQQKKIQKELRIIATKRKDEVEEIKRITVKIQKKISFIHVASAIKFCWLCDDRADAYFRIARIKIWDVAAGFVLVKNCGFEVHHQENNLVPMILKNEYIEKLAKNELRIEPFIIKRKMDF